jgi:hypothetical protein
LWQNQHRPRCLFLAISIYLFFISLFLFFSWLNQHRPRFLSLANVSAVEPLEPDDLGGVLRDGRSMALADGIADPLLLWGSRYDQIWWSKVFRVVCLFATNTLRGCCYRTTSTLRGCY